jgi:pentatricopeptide repeat domain-containing protein 1
MQTAGVTPDGFTYNTLISAYRKGEQWQKAEEAFQQMQAAGVEPNEYTYNSVIRAYTKGEQWQKAEEVFVKMQSAGLTPNKYTYNSLLSVLWECGQRARAIELFMEASEARVYPQGDRKRGQIDLHGLSQGAALASLSLWLDAVAASGGDGLPKMLNVVTGWGEGSRVTGESVVKDAVIAFLADLGSPFEVPSDNPGCLEAGRTEVGEWLDSVGSVVQRVCHADEQARGGGEA